MNADELLRYYERVADAPDAVARLRRFVLDLAVRGKLVALDVADEPADALLARLTDERTRRVTSAEFQEPTSFVKVERGDLPFHPPAHWRWARLIDFALPSYGFAFASAQFNTAKRGIPLIRIRDISATDTEAYFDGPFDPAYLVKDGDYLVGMDGNFNLRRWRGRPGLLNQRVLRINGWRCGVDPEFVRLPLQFILDYLHGETSQTTVKHLSVKQINGIEIPLPPLAEQQRIVAKVDELMALCDRLEAVRATREAARDRLATASLARLNAADPETFHENARFALDALPALTTRPDQIKQLRQTILNLAVRGKLVAQDPTDEPADVLVAKIVEERVRLAKAEGRKQPAPASTDAVITLAFEVPTGWAMPRWETIAKKIGDIDHKMPSAIEEGVPYVSPRDFMPGNRIDFDGAKRISQNDFMRLASKIRPELGDLIFPRYGTIGDNRLVEDAREFLASYSCCVVKLLPGYLDPKYQYLYSISDLCRSQAKAAENKTTQANVGIQSIKEFVVPLPPLAEQRRIVAKVDELMALCDRLEASLASTDTHRRRLLEALLHEALQPAAALEATA